MQKVICIITILATTSALWFLYHRNDVPIATYKPAMIHEVECDDQLFEIIIPAEVNNLETYAEQFCLTLASN